MENKLFDFYSSLMEFLRPNSEESKLILEFTKNSVSIAQGCLNTKKVLIREVDARFLMSTYSKIGLDESKTESEVSHEFVKNLRDRFLDITVPTERSNSGYYDGAYKELRILSGRTYKSASWVSSPLEKGFEEIDEFTQELLSVSGSEESKDDTGFISQVGEIQEKPYSGVCERSYSVIEPADLTEIYQGSFQRLHEYFLIGEGKKWLELYDIEKPLAVALCQGAAMHYKDRINGVKDIDVWFFYPFNKKHLPYRTYWNWDYVNPKFGRHPDIPGYEGRKVDVLVRSLKSYDPKDPVHTVQNYLLSGDTSSSKELAKKAAVMLYPENMNGKVIWYKGIVN